ncbi:hypothetical protein Tco_1503218 [Tanacetum coccineum]
MSIIYRIPLRKYLESAGGAWEIGCSIDRPFLFNSQDHLICNGSVTLLENENFLLLLTYDDQTEAKEEAECETKHETETALVENDEKINTQAAFVELSQGEVNTLDLDMS